MTAPMMELRRAPQSAPTCEGVFYGRPKGSGANPKVIRVVNAVLAGKLVARNFNMWDTPLDAYEWFGPVPTCIPAVCAPS